MGLFLIYSYVKLIFGVVKSLPLKDDSENSGKCTWVNNTQYTVCDIYACSKYTVNSKWVIVCQGCTYTAEEDHPL